ncbi:MAG TPA: hypothetical protein O0X23_00615 [Methanocorpusculum sp.]|nr:hypothetical protein [Methanocorpusculum sp.]
MKKLTRLQKLAIVMGILLIGTYVVAPIVGAKSPGQELGKIIGNVIAHGEITKAHKVMEKAFQKFKEHPLAYGLAAIEVGKDGISTVIEYVDQKGFSTAHDVKYKLNDDDQCIDIYVDDKRTGAKAYKNLIDRNEDEVIKTLRNAAMDAIAIYYAYKNVEKAFQRFKEHPDLYGFSSVEVGEDGLSAVIKMDEQ